MLGPRARRTPNQNRRDRRRIIVSVVIVAVVALILGEVIDDIVKSGPGVQRRANATWVAAASAVIAQSNLEARELPRHPLPLDVASLVRPGDPRGSPH